MIVSEEADEFVKETLPAEGDARRVRARAVRDAGRLLVDGGSRLATTIAINKSSGRLKVQTIQLALEPESRRRAAPSSASTATASFAFELGPLQRQRGADRRHVRPRLDERRRSPTTRSVLPAAALPRRPRLPAAERRSGSSSTRGLVTGGGFLFYDRDNGAVRGRPPARDLRAAVADGDRADHDAPARRRRRASRCSDHLSVEFEPPVKLGPPGSTLRGVGGPVGIHRDAGRGRAARRPAQPRARRDAVPEGSGRQRGPTDRVAAHASSRLRADRHVFGLVGEPRLGRRRRSSPPSWRSSSSGAPARGSAILGQLHVGFPHGRAPEADPRDARRRRSAIWDFARRRRSRSTRRSTTRGSRSSRFSGDVALRHRARRRRGLPLLGRRLPPRVRGARRASRSSSG